VLEDTTQSGNLLPLFLPLIYIRPPTQHNADCEKSRFIIISNILNVWTNYFITLKKMFVYCLEVNTYFIPIIILVQFLFTKDDGKTKENLIFFCEHFRHQSFCGKSFNHNYSKISVTAFWLRVYVSIRTIQFLFEKNKRKAWDFRRYFERSKL
jgi:hypothetical protein